MFSKDQCRLLKSACGACATASARRGIISAFVVSRLGIGGTSASLQWQTVQYARARYIAEYGAVVYENNCVAAFAQGSGADTGVPGCLATRYTAKYCAEVNKSNCVFACAQCNGGVIVGVDRQLKRNTRVAASRVAEGRTVREERPRSS